MGPKGIKLSRSPSTYDFRMDTSDSQRKRKFVDGEGFIHLRKAAKVWKVVSNVNPKISISNQHETLADETAVASPSWVSGNENSVKVPRYKKMLPILATFARVDTSVVNGINAQTSGQIYFEYAANGLKTRKWVQPTTKMLRAISSGGVRNSTHLTTIQARWWSSFSEVSLPPPKVRRY